MAKRTGNYAKYWLGKKLSSEHRAKLSNSHRGKTSAPRQQCACGALFWARPSDIKKGNGKYCSRKCFFINRPKKTFTETYITKNQIRRSPIYKKWQKTIYQRDDYTCQICGKRGGRGLRANHIKPFAEYPDLRFKLENGILICTPCDYSLVWRREIEWESYFNFNLMTRGII